MASSTESILAHLLNQAGLPCAVGLTPIVGRGFENKVSRISLSNGQKVLLRQYPVPRESEHLRAHFLESHYIPSPKLLASSSEAALYEFVDGTLLGDLIETGHATEQIWRMVGDAFRRVHAIKFPTGLTGKIEAGQVTLNFNDPVAQMHSWIDECIPGLQRRAPEALKHLSVLHALVESASLYLRNAPSALGHGDINMWNIIVGESGATLIDWDFPIVCDPAMEIALIDKHASLFNGQGIPSVFFDGYGQSPTEPNTSLNRVVHTVNWAASSDWDEFENFSLPSEQVERTRLWLKTLLEYVHNLDWHIEQLRLQITR